jgi:nucleoside-diphosphate-sugar epimerase
MIEPAASGSKPRCLLTGASGYLGGMIARKLMTAGWDVVAMSRNPRPGEVGFKLGEPVNADALADYDALIHCAYDFGQVSWADIESVNVKGSANLFEAAHKAGIPHLLLISTISAFDGCKSHYGKAKLMIEEHARKAGAAVIRPGLIYGAQPGAMFGRLVSQVRAATFVPMPGDGRQMMYTVHQDDLTDAILKALTAKPVPSQPITAANATPIAFRDIMIAIGKQFDRKVTPIPLPWRLMWVGLRGAELAKLPLWLRSDSLVSLVNQDPSPVLNAAELLGVNCRDFLLDGLQLAA